MAGHFGTQPPDPLHDRQLAAGGFRHFSAIMVRRDVRNHEFCRLKAASMHRLAAFAAGRFSTSRFEDGGRGTEDLLG